MSTHKVTIAAGAAAGTSVMFGFVPLAARELYADGLSTWSLLCWRYLLALVIIFAGIRFTRLRLGTALRQGAWRIALVGVSLGAVQTLCYFQSLRWLDTGIAVLLFYTFPVVTLGVERFFFKQQVARAALLCVIVIFAGAALIAGRDCVTARSTRAASSGRFRARSSTPSIWRPMPACWGATRR
jgi:drug/metabolite transporter (DMT)-like permease